MNQGSEGENQSKILRKKKEVIQKWEILQEHILQMMEEAMHWRNSAEDYDALVRNYYLQRQKHQKEVMRLNQILYGTHHPQIGLPGDMKMTDGCSSQGEGSAVRERNNGGMIIDDNINNNNYHYNNVLTTHGHNMNCSRKRKIHVQQGIQMVDTKVLRLS
jgi:hypothetical protein